MSRITLVILVLASIASTAGAQVHPPENVQLLAHVDRGEGYSGNWGYTAPNGVELAISGTVSGTTFIDATVPTAAHEVAFIPGPGSIWREMAIWSHYCYIVTEAAGAGLQIVDLANPLAPTLVATLNPPPPRAILQPPHPRQPPSSHPPFKAHRQTTHLLHSGKAPV